MTLLNPNTAFAADDSFSTIAERAAQLTRAADDSEQATSNQIQMKQEQNEKALAASDGKTAYDFSVPVQGSPVSFGDLINQSTVIKDEESEQKVKVILVVNMKQDDPIARKNIPELITLASKYGKNGEFAVVCVPTDQGYYEPDTSELLRIKMKSEYGYGINPATHLTDKMNLLGTGAHPFMRWLQNSSRTPAGLGRIEANFEKFLVSGETGRPVRRYPRKYSPYDISDDIEALLKGKPLPPAGANFREEWRNAAYEAEKDLMRFQKGLNVFDQ
eukprot:CAMPEP_0171322410 /NCGR_PEP_ID=MMETSP0816-20121228/114939_1 /TAXON_ID=420281 /ORGANISM="Proboscia inermis, Strain CCAP1064/1" /LENGTH=273 /DNA_ID=CAMNT_0011820873 /DNA_START=108 /DNA_END=929 /DNA_ORIENTATION=-